MTNRAITAEAKLEHLLRTDSFADAPASVEVVETHFAWVFLSRRFVYKMKKPIRFRDFDFTTLAARRADCELELALNRRLAEEVYIAIVPLAIAGPGFELEGSGEPVEWLVKMHRLPRERFLDAAMRSRTVEDAALARVVDKLCEFYARSARAAWTGPLYRQVLARRAREHAAELASPDLGFDRKQVRAIAAAQLRFIHAQAAALDARIAAGRVVDAHGDLRPEHVLLADPPQIIDCLEFSAELRLLDGAAEIGFLALECARLGAPSVGARLETLYRQRCGDDVDTTLARFYRSLHAVDRALLAALRLREEPAPHAAAAWRERARWYLDAAEAAVTRPDARERTPPAPP